MATVEDCEQALTRLAERMARSDPAGGGNRFDRTLSCTLRDLGVTFTGRILGGRLVDITRTGNPSGDGTAGTSDSGATGARADPPRPAKAQIRLDMTSDDLVALVDGRLHVASAWAGGRVGVHAGVFDMMRLRALF